MANDASEEVSKRVNESCVNEWVSEGDFPSYNLQ